MTSLCHHAARDKKKRPGLPGAYAFMGLMLSWHLSDRRLHTSGRPSGPGTALLHHRPLRLCWKFFWLRWSSIPHPSPSGTKAFGQWAAMPQAKNSHPPTTPIY